MTGVVWQVLKRALGRSWRVLARCWRAVLGRGRLETRSRLWTALVLFLVIGSSFYWVARRTGQELMEQMYKRAKLVADAVLTRRDADAKNLRTFDLLPIQFPHPLHQSSLEQRGFRWRHIYQAGTFEPSQPPGKVEQLILPYQARDDWEQYFLDSWAKPETHKPVDRRTRDPVTRQRLYQWLTPVTAEESCLTCHSDFAAGSFQGMLSVELPFGRERRELHKTRWLMVASAVVTWVVAFATLYLLMRLLIIKP
ncbi:MAG: DUF3365 domain-containing protein, partial [Planctomycetes bacterium]|nr:DUF3365 domain-containing protein [Planctomycetota bacterium]